jgi:uncharacterized repeat protein (TIGR02543 family)
MTVKNILNRGLPLLLTALLTACANPFFSALLGDKETSGPAVYTVTFMLNDGTETVHAVKTVTAPATTIGAEAFPAAPADRNEYHFAGWNTAADGLETGFTASTTVSGDITVYATWTEVPPGSYIVTFLLNDGTEAVHAVKTVANPATTIDALPASPSRPGYIFGDWYTAQGEFTGTTTVSGNITVHARWTAETYTVTFKSGYSLNETLHTKMVTVPVTAIGAENFPETPPRTGYTFGGWYTEPGGGGTVFTAATPASGDITVYARWTAETYTVRFNRNYTPDTVLYTRTVTVPSTTIGAAYFPTNPVRTGYIFGGWYTESDGGGTGFTATSAVSAGITVYARWDTYSWTVTFDENGGDAAVDPATKPVASPNINAGSLPAQPSRSGGYMFAGWNSQADGKGTVFTALTTVTGNIRVYARWATEYDITLNLDAGDGAFSETAFTLSKNGTGYPAAQTIHIIGDYANPRWFVDETFKGTAMSIDLSAADYGIGSHNLTLFISKNSVTWSKEITFTVNN